MQGELRSGICKQVCINLHTKITTKKIMLILIFPLNLFFVFVFFLFFPHKHRCDSGGRIKEFSPNMCQNRKQDEDQTSLPKLVHYSNIKKQNLNQFRSVCFQA